MLSLVGKVALFVRHEYFLHPKSGSLQEVSREPVHIYSGAVTASVYASITVVTFYCSYKFIVGAAASMSEVAFRNPPLNPFIIHKNPTPYWLGFVAQIGLRPISPLPQTDLAYSHGTWDAKRCEAV